MTVNGGCCPRELSQQSAFPFVQRTFELVGGTGGGIPTVEQLPDVRSIFERAHRWLDDVEDKLAGEIAARGGG